MDLLDVLLSHLTGGTGQLANAPKQLVKATLHMIHDHEGGLKAIVDRFHDQGLGSAVSSWIGKEAKLPVSMEQIKSVVGPDHMAEIARKAGLSIDDTAFHLANLLPHLIDKLTPHGTLPAGSLVEHVQRLLGRPGEPEKPGQP